MTLPQAQRLDLAHCTARAAARAPGSATLGCVVEIARHFPDDVGILAPLLLNRVVLEPGQALYLPAGELHAYLGGVGIELMGNSDNVIRGGLTAKHVDVPELLQTLRFRQGWPAVLTPRAADGAAAVYPIASAPGAHESHFELTRIELSAECPYTSSARASVEIALCTDGAVRAVDPLRNESVDVPRGAAVLLPAALPAYRLECIEGSAVVHRAGVAR
jgi:mannose-6-phosphate isomerase